MFEIKIRLTDEEFGALKKAFPVSFGGQRSIAEEAFSNECFELVANNGELYVGTVETETHFWHYDRACDRGFVYDKSTSVLWMIEPHRESYYARVLRKVIPTATQLICRCTVANYVPWNMSVAQYCATRKLDSKFALERCIALMQIDPMVAEKTYPHEVCLEATRLLKIAINLK